MLAITITLVFIKMPKISHKKTPDTKQIYISSEISRVLPLFMVLIACGKKLVVVKIAAIVPITSVAADTPSGLALAVVRIAVRAAVISLINCIIIVS